MQSLGYININIKTYIIDISSSFSVDILVITIIPSDIQYFSHLYKPFGPIFFYYILLWQGNMGNLLICICVKLVIKHYRFFQPS